MACDAVGSEPNDKWVIGAALSIIGSICSNLGVNIQKWAFQQNAKRPIHQRVVYYKQPTWFIGLFLVIFGSLGDFLALGLAAQSIVAPIGSVTLAANIGFAVLWLKERLTRSDLFGTVLICCGSVLAASFGDHSNQSYSLADLVALYAGTLFQVYAVFMLATGFAMYAVVRHCERLRSQIDLKREEAHEALRACNPVASMLQQEICVHEATYSRFRRFHPICLCFLSGMFSGQSILFAKCIAELIRHSVVGDFQLDSVLPYVFLIACLVSIGCQLHFLALALTRFDALYCVPMFECSFITVSTLGGGFYFNEFRCFDTIQWIMFPLGLGMTLWGVSILSKSKMVTSEEPHEGQQNSIVLHLRDGEPSDFSHKSGGSFEHESVDDQLMVAGRMNPLVLPVISFKRLAMSESDANPAVEIDLHLEVPPSLPSDPNSSI